MAVHPELLKKWTQLFKYIDVNNTGKMSINAVGAGLLKMCDSVNVAAQTRDQCLQDYSEVWWAFIGSTDTNLEEFLAKVSAVYTNHAGTMARGLIVMVTRNFQTLDVNDKGFIAFDVFEKYHNAFGLMDTDAIKKIFDLMDANYDEVISLDGFVDSHLKYYMDSAVMLDDCPCFGFPV